MSTKVAVIGAGFAGLSTSSYLAAAGYEVDVYEKHAIPGGRARQFISDSGFVFDMGPSWYWMPDIIENFFKDFGRSSSDFYELKTLDPQFEMIFEKENIAVPNNFTELKDLFEKLEPGAGHALDKFMQAAAYKYKVGMQEFVNKPCHHWLEFVAPKILKSAVNLDLLSNFRSYVSKYFKHDKLRTLMEFPVIFLGASPKNIPALYSLMNYGGYRLGTHYPMGGMYKLVEGMYQVALEQGVNFYFGRSVEHINIENGRANSITVNGNNINYDFVIGAGDYHHMESLTEEKYRNYTESYWDNKTFAPSCLIYYLGFNTKIPNLKHHTLFFDQDFDTHIEAIYQNPSWPQNPLFYVCSPSQTDDSVAPEGMENVFILIPTAIHNEPDENIKSQYLDQVLNRLEKHVGVEDLKGKIIFKKIFSVQDFKQEYHAYGGNAYGLANTLRQTAVLKPKIRNKKIANIYYAGQLTVPGPGVPPSIISGRIIAKEIINSKV